MKRATGMLMVLALVGGCNSFQSDSDLGGRSNYSPRVYPAPGPATTSWTENDRMKNYQLVGSAPVSGVVANNGAPTTTVCAAMPSTQPQPADPGILPAPASLAETPAAEAPKSTTSVPAALAAAAPIPSTSLVPAGYQEQANPAAAPSKTDVVQAQASSSAPVISDQILPPATDDKHIAKGDVLPPPDIKSVPSTEPMPTASESVPMATRAVHLEQQTITSAPPSVRLVNSKRITINYEIKDVGPSGVSGIELWYTQDGKAWTKKDVSSQPKPPYVIEVADEGLYGFTLLARNGIGLSREAPKAGDLPQIWVEVDMTKPVVELTGIHANCTSKSQNVVVRWKASDKNFGPRPITISYAEKTDGPWHVIAANVSNTGRYEYPLPPEAPARFHVKLEATDLVGNVATAQTPKPVLMDRSQPTVSILTVEGSK